MPQIIQHKETKKLLLGEWGKVPWLGRGSNILLIRSVKAARHDLKVWLSHHVTFKRKDFKIITVPTIKVKNAN